ncbi:MAG: type II toxin-antitoxin system VapC family toxin [Terriglobales bacterium]
MIYLDAAFIAKCYLHEPGADKVRRRARQSSGLASCALGRLEFSNVLRRHRQEGRLSRAATDAVWREFLSDESSRIWTWYPVSAVLLEQARDSLDSLADEIYLRSSDALHLTCARLHGHREIFTNDRHMLAVAPHFALRGVNLLIADC